MVAHKRIAMAFSGGLIAEIVNRLIPIVILHFVATRIGVERFGFAQFGIQIMDLAIYGIIFGFHTVAAVQIGAVRDDPKAVGAIISETTVWKIIFAASAGLILFGMISALPAYRNFLPLVIALSFILVTTALDLNYVNIGTQTMLSLSAMTVGCKLVSLAAIILLIAGPEDAILYAVLTLAANGLVACLNWWVNIRRYPYREFSSAAWRRRFTDAAPFAATVLLLIVLDRFDLFVVLHFGGTSEAGLYASASRLYFSFVNIVSALGGVFFAELVAIDNRRAFTRMVQLSFKAMLMMIVPLSVGVWFVDAELMRQVVGEDFVAGAPVLSVLLLACLAHVAIVVFGIQVMQVRKQSRTLNYVLAGTLGLGVVAAIGFYQSHGMIGVAWALVVAKAFAAIMLAWLMRPQLDWLPLVELFKVGIPGGVMAGALYALASPSLIYNLLLGALVFGTAVLIVNRRDLSQMYAVLRKRSPHH